MNSAPSIVARILLALIACTGLFLVVNGLLMLIKPLTWYAAVPGVTTTGPFNQHFVRDIGLIQMFLGIAFWVGMARPSARHLLWGAATIWLTAHAFFHFWEVAVGICSASAIVRDFPAVTLPALIGIAATVWAWRLRTTGRVKYAAEVPK